MRSYAKYFQIVFCDANKKQYHCIRYIDSNTVAVYCQNEWHTKKIRDVLSLIILNVWKDLKYILENITGQLSESQITKLKTEIQLFDKGDKKDITLKKRMTFVDTVDLIESLLAQNKIMHEETYKLTQDIKPENKKFKSALMYNIDPFVSQSDEISSCTDEDLSKKQKKDIISSVNKASTKKQISGSSSNERSPKKPIKKKSVAKKKSSAKKKTRSSSSETLTESSSEETIDSPKKKKATNKSSAKKKICSSSSETYTESESSSEGTMDSPKKTKNVKKKYPSKKRKAKYDSESDD